MTDLTKKKIEVKIMRFVKSFVLKIQNSNVPLQPAETSPELQ